MTRTSPFGPIFIILAAFLWGLDGILRRSLFTLPPTVIVFYEHLIGALLITPFLLIQLKLDRLHRRELLALVWISLVSGVAGTVMFTAALDQAQYLPFSIVFLLQKLQPLFALAAGRIILKETLHRRYLGWAALALVSAYFVTFKNGQVNLATGSGTLTAAALALGAAVAWGSSTAISRWGLLRLSTTTMTGLRFIFTVPFALIAVFLFNHQTALTSITTSQLLRLLLIALSTGLVALWIYYRGLKFTLVKVTTILELVFPLTAVAIDVFLYHTFLAPSQYLAAAVLLYAIYQVSLLNYSRAGSR